MSTSNRLSGDHPSLLVIVGPTASGKSKLAMDIALERNGEIVCADSQTIRRGMDIGTAKPSKEDRMLVRHHLIDIVDPYDSFSAADFKVKANLAIDDIRSRNKLPILVGGTGLYIDAVVFDFQFYGSRDQDKQQQLESKSIDELTSLINDRGIELPENSQNRRHLIRALESGGLTKANYDVLPSGILMIGLAPPRELLVQRIENRITEMIQNGLLSEITILKENFGPPPEKVDAIAYNIAFTMVSELGCLDEELFKERFAAADKKYAKRQLTWFKRNPHIHWFITPADAKTYLGSIL